MGAGRPFRLHLRELRISGPELAGILRIGVPAGIQGAVFSLSNTVVQATINGFGSAAIAGSAATLNFEYYTYFFVNAFGQTAVTFTGQNFAAKNADRCRAIFRWCMLFGSHRRSSWESRSRPWAPEPWGCSPPTRQPLASASYACGSWNCPTA